MLTPESIASMRFNKQMGGYNQEEVEEYLQQVAQQMSALQAEKEELEQKLELLAEKIEQYRADEDSLRNALLGAQKLGDSVIRDSKNKAEYILREARMKADDILGNAQKNIEKEHATLIQMQKEVTKFKNQMLSIYQQHLELITTLPEYKEEPQGYLEEPAAPAAQPAAPSFEEAPARPAEETFTAPADEPVFAPQEGLFEADPLEHEPAPAAEPAGENLRPAFAHFDPDAEPAFPMGGTSSAESKFGPLKFGDHYDVQRSENQGKGLFRKKHR